MNVRYSYHHSFAHLCGSSAPGSWLAGWSASPMILGTLLKQPKPMEPVDFRDFYFSLDSLHPFPLTVHLRLFISLWSSTAGQANGE